MVRAYQFRSDDYHSDLLHMTKEVTFDERIDLLYDRAKDGDAPDSLLIYDNLECGECHHDHDGKCHCGCPKWVFWEDVA